MRPNIGHMIWHILYAIAHIEYSVTTHAMFSSCTSPLHSEVPLGSYSKRITKLDAIDLTSPPL
jgi:hypothetical protein